MASTPTVCRTSGWVSFASWMLLLAGLFQLFTGFLGVLSQDFYAVGQNWFPRLDVTTWGWIHMVVGIRLFVTGVFVPLGRSWANWLGIIAAGVSAIGMFAWTSYIAVWAAMIIAINVLIVYGLAAHGGEIGNESPGGIGGR